jgi:hypothetical protein
MNPGGIAAGDTSLPVGRAGGNRPEFDRRNLKAVTDACEGGPRGEHRLDGPRFENFGVENRLVEFRQDFDRRIDRAGGRKIFDPVRIVVAESARCLIEQITCKNQNLA